MIKPPLHKVKIKTILINDLIPDDSISLDDFIIKLMDMYEELAKSYKHITVKTNDNDLELYGYIEMSEIQCERERQNIDLMHTEDYKEYVQARENIFLMGTTQ